MMESTIFLDRKEYQDCLEVFEELWRGGEEPDLRFFLPEEGPGYAQALRELLSLDLEMRLRRGLKASTISYLESFPGVSIFPEEILNLVEREIRVRKAFQLPLPDLADLTEGFPTLSVQLRQLFRKIGNLPPEIPDFDGMEEIGKGGMGIVYRTRQISLEREVALKVIRPDRISDPDEVESYRKQFRFEARKMARVNHPNVVKIFGTGEFGKDWYLTMELVDGRSLKRVLDEEGVLDPLEVARMAVQVVAGVIAIHATGIIHRDLKPDNILLTTSGQAKVADFGLARPLDAEQRTQQGLFKGTASYCSPEQAAMDGRDLTERTDVYGLGGVLYAALTGHSPFPAEREIWKTLELVRNQPVVPVRRLRPDCPRDLETICLKCLEKDPDRRYASARGLMNDLNRFLDGRPIQARPVGFVERIWLWSKRNQALSVALIAIGIILTTSLSIFVCRSWWMVIERERANWRETNTYLASTELKALIENSHEFEGSSDLIELKKVLLKKTAYITDSFLINLSKTK